MTVGAARIAPTAAPIPTITILSKHAEIKIIIRPIHANIVDLFLHM
jgi:hypothetical protein